ncbi:MAG: C4-type zinc ribbon domain-containing protein, partial [Planctomycetia bacterium]|nr:C4-type zinc ribbon domain-containing protein [Planctomycetia bacterium]
ALEAMEVVDQRRAVVDASLEQLEKRREETRHHTEQYAAEAPQMKADVIRLESELTHEEAKLVGDFRSQYQRLIRDKKADSFAPLDDRRTCTGCHTQITSQLYLEVRTGEIRFCRTCGRILYLPTSRDG